MDSFIRRNNYCRRDLNQQYSDCQMEQCRSKVSERELYQCKRMYGSKASVLAVTVNALPVPTITGPAPACVGTTGNVYTTESGMTNYTWTVSGGGSVTAGGNSTVTQ